MVDRIPAAGGIGPLEQRAPITGQPGLDRGGAGGVAAAFREALVAAGREREVQLSSHALTRLEQRRIDLGDDQLDRLRHAMDSLAERGGRQSLVMLDQVAYVVHVPSHTVVTAVAPGAEKEAVFTQIDSVAIA